MITTEEFEKVFIKILNDVRVELSDEFDNNFERQAFFSEKWARRKSPLRPGGKTLIDSGGLRRSLKAQVLNDGVKIFTTEPHAQIHNEGGKIKVTAKMKRYFWARYIQTTKGFGRRKNGSVRKDKRTMQLSTEAEFWKYLALMKVGKTIVIPKRQFLGMSPEIEIAINEIIDENINEFFEHYKLL